MKRTRLILAVASTVAVVASAQVLQSPGAPSAAAGTAASLPVEAIVKAQEAAPARTTSTLVARQAPVPTLPGNRAPAGVAMVEPGAAREPATAQNPMRSLTETEVRTAIATDGYKTVLGVTQAADGSWRARVLRGPTEIVLRVNRLGSVIAD